MVGGSSSARAWRCGSARSGSRRRPFSRFLSKAFRRSGGAIGTYALDPAGAGRGDDGGSVMINRRKALRTTLFGSIAAGATTDAEARQAAAQSARETDEHAARIVSALNDIRDELAAARRFTEIAAVRDAQKTFLRTNGKLPECIDVGIDVWFAVHD